MKIVPIAADSLGARSMATLVETSDVTVLLDPGVRLGPYRYDLPPHPAEEARQRNLWREIRGAAKNAHVLTVSHYDGPAGSRLYSSPSGKEAKDSLLARFDLFEPLL